MISLNGGIGNIVMSMPFMWFLKARSEVVIGRAETTAYSREACELAAPACDEMVDGKWHVVGAVDRGLPTKGAPCKTHDRPEWEMWFEMHGFVTPKAEDVNMETAWEEAPKQHDIVLSPTSKANWPMKAWPHWGRLAEMMPGCAVVGLPGEGGDFGTGCVDLRGKLSLRQVAGLFRRAKFVVAQEGGMAHLSAAQGTRTYILYGGTSWWKNFPPRNGVLVTAERLLPCQPCQFKDCNVLYGNSMQVFYGCKTSDRVDWKWSRCMHALTPDRVMEVVGWGG